MGQGSYSYATPRMVAAVNNAALKENAGKSPSVGLRYDLANLNDERAVGRSQW
jgi:hypothetical protein